MLCHYYIQNVKDGIQIGAYKTNKESVAHFRQFISVKVKETLRKLEAQFSGKIKKIEAQEKCWFSYKKNV